MINETEIKVRYVETDQMGIVHHSNYFAWFEVGRTELLSYLGFPYSELEMKGLLLPIIDAYCKYIYSAKYEDEIIIQTKVAKLRCSQVNISYVLLRKKDKKILATGYTSHAFVSANLRPINLKKHDEDLYNMLASCI